MSFSLRTVKQRDYIFFNLSPKTRSCTHSLISCPVFGWWEIRPFWWWWFLVVVVLFFSFLSNYQSKLLLLELFLGFLWGDLEDQQVDSISWRPMWGIQSTLGCSCWSGHLRIQLYLTVSLSSHSERGSSVGGRVLGVNPAFVGTSTECGGSFKKIETSY